MILYRPEIDGMRAISVLSVVLYHAGITGFSGGYVGVDVFFVISGFLITSLLLKDWETKEYSLVNFWARRARRILPAFLTVLLLSAIYAWFFLPPLTLVKLGELLIASIFFAANFWMSGAVNYFSPEAANSPLSHIWSLAVEEQFYLLFPLFLLFALRAGRKLTVSILLGILVFSLLFAQWSGNLKVSYPFVDDYFYWFAPSAFSDFYLPTGRAWELLVGCILAFSPKMLDRLPLIVRDAVAAIGLAMIGYAVVFYSGETPYPGFSTLIPVIGAALIILGANNEGIINKLLTLKPMVFIGLISYSLYLIHQPLLGFYRTATFEHDIPVTMAGVLIAASIVLSYASWRFIEQPCRNPKRVANRYFYPALGVMTVLCLSLGIASKVTAGPRMQNASEQDRYFLSIDDEVLGEYVAKRFSQNQGPFDLSRPSLKVLVVGDSHGQDFANVIGEMVALNQVQLRGVVLDNDCTKYVKPLSQGESPSTAWSIDHEEQMCNHQLQKFMEAQSTKTADIIFIAQQWREKGAMVADVLLENLKTIGAEHVVIVGKKRFGPIRPAKYLKKSYEELQALVHKPKPDHVKINQILAEKTGARFLDFVHIICTLDGACPVFTPEGKLISYDGGHLTQEGAIYVSEELSAEPAFWAFFTHLPNAQKR